MLVVRPAGPADLDHLLELAILSGPGFTSLPEDPDQLAERLDLSRDSFAGALQPQERWYTLMLEESETGDVDGIGSVKAAVIRQVLAVLPEGALSFHLYVSTSLLASAPKDNVPDSVASGTHAPWCQPESTRNCPNAAA